MDTPAPPHKHAHDCTHAGLWYFNEKKKNPEITAKEFRGVVKSQLVEMANTKYWCDDSRNN